MMKPRLTPFFAAALLVGAATPVAADAADCNTKIETLDARIAAARESHAEDRIARLRAVRERVRHFCSRRHGHASAVHAPPPPPHPRGAASGTAAQTAGRQPA
ncbi:DUF1090 family protein [Burkholderia sp. Bp8963]|uniref:DUF1090 family protein n=1 Tax=Burkholderia sp. Bp8963 TaxID=2184547 RepID=UPI000F59FF9D|nr:DUF1090 family protein [Burkholderia sp. Bp8963]RQS70865.1 DUF1090 family protein [Burkholderia sp. Bp8963]